MPSRSTTKDIEHAPVSDDPRAWGHARKTLTLVIVPSPSMIAGLATTIQNPLSVFILVQGLFPLVWSAISEINGCKVVYLSLMSLFIVGSAVADTSKTIGLVMGMRALQAMCASAVMAIAAATLADIYEPHERGAKMGIYYVAPPLGASIGPFLGGIFAQALGWRAVFWFAVISGTIVLLCLLIFFKDSLRKERSLSYQNVLRKRLKEHQLCTAAQSRVDIMECSTDKSQQLPSEKTIEGLEAGTNTPSALHTINDITLSFTDVNPLPPTILVLKRWNNNVILLASGLIFGLSFNLSYTCTGTLSTRYGYDALRTGLVLLSSGVGDMCGSTLGDAHGGKTHLEMRLQSTLPAMTLVPLSALGYAWTCQTHQPVAAICVMLFIAGFSSMWMYSSTLAYIVDANTGRSSTAVATNSAYRGILAFIAAEIAIPLQDWRWWNIHFWAGLLFIMELLVLLVLKFGNQWREKCEEAERRMSE
ncbi:MFS general substrate transporter [Imleria badia]|nr:MFS general substrate transporter [Imleria badia]